MEARAPAAVTQAAVDHAPVEAVVLPQEAADDADKQKRMTSSVILFFVSRGA